MLVSHVTGQSAWTAHRAYTEGAPVSPGNETSLQGPRSESLVRTEARSSSTTDEGSTDSMSKIEYDQRIPRSYSTLATDRKSEPAISSRRDASRSVASRPRSLPASKVLYTSKKQEYARRLSLDESTEGDDDALAISCLQLLCQAVPKLEPTRQSSEKATSFRESRADSPTLLSSDDRRSRVPMACTRCKTAHTRCDTKRPCGRCVRRGVADSCVDAIPKRRGRKRSEDSNTEVPAPPNKSARGLYNTAPLRRKQSLSSWGSHSDATTPPLDDASY